MDRLKNSILETMMCENFQIRTRNAGVFRFPAAYRFEMHNHREIEINYINSGSCIMGIDGVLVPLKRGDCIIIYEGVPHQFIVEDKENCRITQLEFEVKNQGSLRQTMRFFEKREEYYRLCGCENVCEYMESLCRLYREERETKLKELMMQLGFFQLFLELSEKIGYLARAEMKKGKAGRIGEVIRYINDNWDKEINIESLAQQFEVSSRYIRKCFREETGVSCQKYICTLRISKAKELLWFTSKSVTDIALETGFGSSQYFCRVFLQYTQMSPMEYRNLWKGQKAQEMCMTEAELMK